MASKRTETELARDRKRWWGIHDKDTYICPDCGRTQSEHDREWQVHHIDGIAGNVVGLCLTCHKVRHGAERWNVELYYWKKEFLKLGSD